MAEKKRPAKKGESSLKTLKALLEFAKPYKHLFLPAMILALISVAATLYAPILIGKGVDVIIGRDNVDFDALIPIMIKLGVLISVSALSQWLMTLCTNKITYNIVRDLRIKAFDKLTRLPLSYIDSHPHGDLISRVITDVEQISDGLLMGFAQLFTGICTIVGTLVFMLTINFKITMVVVLITPLSLFVARFVSGNTYKLFHKQSVARGELTDLVEEMTGNRKTVSAFSYEQEAQRRFDDANKELSKISVKAIFFSSLTNPTTRFVNGLVYTGVGIFGAFSAFSGAITVGQLSSFLTYANQYTKPFNEISGVITELQGALASASRVFSLIAEKQETADSENAIELAHPDGTVDVIKSFLGDDRLVYIAQDSSYHAIGGNWNAALHHPQCGRFALQLDSDDLYSDAGTVQKFVDAFREQDCAMVVGTYRITDFDLNTIPPGVIDHKEWTLENGRNNALRVNGLGAPRGFWTPLLRKLNFPTTKYGEDYAVGLRISREYRIGRIYDVMYNCRRWDDNSDHGLSVEKVNSNNLYKDRLRTWELMARIAQNGK